MFSSGGLFWRTGSAGPRDGWRHSEGVSELAAAGGRWGRPGCWAPPPPPPGRHVPAAPMRTSTGTPRLGGLPFLRSPEHGTPHERTLVRRVPLRGPHIRAQRRQRCDEHGRAPPPSVCKDHTQIVTGSTSRGKAGGKSETAIRTGASACGRAFQSPAPSSPAACKPACPHDRRRTHAELRMVAHSRGPISQASGVRATVAPTRHRLTTTPGPAMPSLPVGSQLQKQALPPLFRLSRLCYDRSRRTVDFGSTALDRRNARRPPAVQPRAWPLHAGWAPDRAPCSQVAASQRQAGEARRGLRATGTLRGTHHLHRAGSRASQPGTQGSHPSTATSLPTFPPQSCG